ncbi:TraR/DksA family transcriptional regulator [Streptomyces wuyuanensis]|uniref:RNA polymerase-binding transcription factor DksA n=1 Tax=Streptomyces wuyuanensis TaxID=1196353 RepID=A0A1G9TZ46_9ACTN|nr:RNA polymerase-binding transcription factor DksA [Streptomyces wuyuanensis]
MHHQTIGDHDTVVPARAPTTAAQNPVLEAGDLVALRENLHEQYLFRQEQLRQIGSSAPSRADDLLAQQAPSQLEVRVKVAASARMVLADVEAALRRMDEGRYGACHLCRRPIARERLLIVPQARYCSRCQQVREAGQ